MIEIGKVDCPFKNKYGARRALLSATKRIDCNLYRGEKSVSRVADNITSITGPPTTIMPIIKAL